MTPFELPWYVLAFAIFHVAIFALGVLIRAGVLRYWERNYWNRDLPIELRNGPFAFVPFSVALSSYWILLALARLPLPLDLGYWPLALLPVLLLLSLVTLYRPPEFLKPRWLREKERAIREGRATVPPSLPPRRLSRRVERRDQDDRRTAYTNDAAGRLISVTGPARASAALRYDGDGNLYDERRSGDDEDQRPRTPPDPLRCRIRVSRVRSTLFRPSFMN